MLLLWPARVVAICLEVVLAFAATEIPFICCQVFAPRILAETVFLDLWHEVHLRIPIPPWPTQCRIVDVYARQIPHRQGWRLWLLVHSLLHVFFLRRRPAVGQTSPLNVAGQLPISGLAAAKLRFGGRQYIFNHHPIHLNIMN